MERYFRIQFTASLERMMLAFKMQCDIEVFWKRGEKVASTEKIPFRNCTANFNKQLTISCNMVFDSEKKAFKEKQTKFAMVLYTEKGNKQAGQILFDVAPFLNQRCQTKSYELGLAKCPDKNARLYFSLRAKIMEQKSHDTISESSLISVDIQRLTDKSNVDFSADASNLKGNSQDSKIQVFSLPQSQNNSVTSIMSKNKQKSAQMVPTTDRPGDSKRLQIPNKQQTDRTQVSAQTIKNLQAQNKKIREQLKKKQQLKKQNEQLKRRLKDDDYQSCKQFKKKIQQGKKEIQHLVQESKGAKKVNEDIKKLEKEILKCKQQIMRIFNEAEKFGPQAMDKIQQACGIKEY